MPLRLYNTLTRRLEEFRPADPARITFYSCGPTVYDDAHIGNFRSFLAADLLRRWLESPLCELANETLDQRAEREKRGREVVHVMNITDVGHMTDDAEGGEHGEDRMAIAGRRLAEAKKAGKIPAGVEINPNDPYQIARFYEMRFREDAKRLGLKLAIDAERDPTLMPRATENVPGMIAVIKRLLATPAPDGQPFAYVTGEPGFRVVYFRVQSFAPYGKLSGNTLDKLREGEGGRVSAQHQQQKKHPADFLLWKEDPRHIMKWESPWGWGYPGWHIECSVMSASRLRAASVSETSSLRAASVSERSSQLLTPEDLASLSLRDGEAVIDLHSGGEDNIFPHHECEIAQSCSAFNQSPQDGTYAAMWFHPRFLLVEGEKMSKSKGNFFTARDLFAPPPQGKGIEPAALRLELIKTHYRSNANFTMQGLADSQRTVERWRRARFDIARRSYGMSAESRKLLCDYINTEFTLALHDDLNIAGAIAGVNQWINGAMSKPVDESKVSQASDIEIEQAIAANVDKAQWREPLDLLRYIEPVLGVLSLERPSSAQTSIGVFIGIDHDDRVVSLLEARRDARAAKDFKRSDQIRDELATLGYAIKDMAGGKVEVRRA